MTYPGLPSSKYRPLVEKYLPRGAGAVFSFDVGSKQPQRVPPFAPPGIRHLAALEYDVVDRPLTEEVAGGEACVPGADDDRGGALGGLAAQATSTVTFVGFVRASNTAERFWDWATSASISCLEASASMVNVTLMSL